MALRDYLPSAKFVSIVGSLALSVGLVYAADRLTAPKPPATISSSAQPASDPNWQATLEAIQAESATAAFKEPDPNFVNTLLEAAQSQNVTETVGKSIFVNLSAAKAQGLGGDIPTQEQIIAAAQEQMKSSQAKVTLYTNADLTIVPPTNMNMHEYGNKVMQTLNNYPEASEAATLLAIDYIVEAGDKTQVTKLASIGAAHKAASQALLTVPVPQTLAPLHLALANSILQISETYKDMQTIGSDPLRGLVALQKYQSLMDEGAGVFTNIAESLNRGGILFTKDEPGSAWSIFLASGATAP